MIHKWSLEAATTAVVCVFINTILNAQVTQRRRNKKKICLCGWNLFFKTQKQHFDINRNKETTLKYIIIIIIG